MQIDFWVFSYKMACRKRDWLELQNIKISWVWSFSSKSHTYFWYNSLKFNKPIDTTRFFLKVAAKFQTWVGVQKWLGGCRYHFEIWKGFFKFIFLTFENRATIQPHQLSFLHIKTISFAHQLQKILFWALGLSMSRVKLWSALNCFQQCEKLLVHCILGTSKMSVKVKKLSRYFNFRLVSNLTQVQFSYT